jgi:hypothetical protein
LAFKKTGAVLAKSRACFYFIFILPYTRRTAQYGHAGIFRLRLLNFRLFNYATDLSVRFGGGSGVFDNMP